MCIFFLVWRGDRHEPDHLSARAKLIVQLFAMDSATDAFYKIYTEEVRQTLRLTSYSS